MLAIKWAREQKIPFLGICFGFQMAVVEWARNVCGFEGTPTLPSPPSPFAAHARSCLHLTCTYRQARLRASSTPTRHTR